MQFTPSPYGTVTPAADGTFTIRHERTLPHPQPRVWQALTEPDQIARWFVTMQLPAVGEPFTVVFMEGSRMESRLIHKDEPSLLEYSWTNGLNDEPSYVRFELHEDGPAATRLVLTHRAIHTHLVEHSDGWHLHLDWLAQVLGGEIERLPRFEDLQPSPYESHYKTLVQQAQNA